MITAIRPTTVIATALTFGCWGQAVVAADEPTVTLTVAAPTGTSLRLEHSVGSGWKFVASDDAGELVKSTLTETAGPRAAENPTTEEPLAVFLDKPTGFIFVYLADRGWIFAGSSDAGARSVMTALAMTDEPMTMFVDGPTGFVFTYGREASWKYVGRVGDTKH